MIKAQALKKQFIKLAIIGTVVISLSGAATYGVFSWSSGLQDEARTAKNRLSRTQNDVRSREEKNREALQYLELYSQITGDSETAKISELNREKAEEWIKETALRYNIMNLEGSVEPIAPIANPAFRKNVFEGIQSEITLRFAAMTDEQVYRFTQDMLRHFPGYIKIIRFNVNKRAEITNQTLDEVSRGQLPELVAGDIQFHWIGIRELGDGENESGAQDAGGGYAPAQGRGYTPAPRTGGAMR